MPIQTCVWFRAWRPPAGQRRIANSIGNFRVQRADVEKSSALARSFAGDAGQGSRVLCDGFGEDAVVDELTFAAAFDEAGAGENFQVMGNGGGSDAAHG